MADWFRFGCAYWHTMRGTGADPFGAGTANHPWDDGSDSIANAQNRARIFFDFMEKVGKGDLTAILNSGDTWIVD